PCLLGSVQVTVAEVVIAAGGGQRGADLGIGQPAGQGGVAAVPQRGGQVAAGFFYDELDQGAGVEVDQRHPQGRWSLTRSATGRRGRGRGCPDALGRGAAAARAMIPSAASRSRVAVAVRPSSRASFRLSGGRSSTTLH